MEKLYNYLFERNNFYFENSIDSDNDFYKINQFYIYKKLADKQELQKILNKYQDLYLFNKYEFNVFKKHRLNLLVKGLNSIEFDKNEKQYIYMSKITGDNIHDKYVMSLKASDSKMDFAYESVFPSVDKGIIFLKEKRSKKKEKNFKNLNDLLKSDSIGLYEQKIDANKIKIICYDYSMIDDFFKEEKDFIFPILFAGQISSNKDTKDSKFTNIPYGGTVINWTISRKDVWGRYTLYPLLASYNPEGILISDRDSLSVFSKAVWKGFFNTNEIFDEKMPIDDWQKPITKTKEDDGRIFKDETNKQPEYEEDELKKLSEYDQLLKLREKDPYNWAYKLKDSVKKEAQNIRKKLIENHHNNVVKNIMIKKSFDFIKKLEDLSNDFFDKNLV